MVIGLGLLGGGQNKEEPPGWRVPVLSPSPAGRSPQAVTRSKDQPRDPAPRRATGLIGAPIPITVEQTPANPPKAVNALHNRVHVLPRT